MGIFSSIMDKIFSPAEAAQPSAAAAAPAAGGAQGGAAGRAQPSTAAPGGSATAARAPKQAVDVEAVLTKMAGPKGGGNWRTSIVDLLKLLDLDSSLDARKELAAELNVNAGPHGSAEQNIALHKAVMRQLAENGGKVPASLKD
jgi:Domain of unknown function (DUF3597)